MLKHVPYIHFQMPKAGFEYTRLNPVDSDHLWNEEMTRVNHTLEFEYAERLLLGINLFILEFSTLV